MRQCNHGDGVRLFSDAPVVDIDTGCEGQTVYILCRRSSPEVILGMKLLTRSSLPENSTALQGVNHENRPAAVAAVLDTSGAVRVGAVPRREGTGR